MNDATSLRTTLLAVRFWALLSCLACTGAIAQQPSYPRAADVTTIDGMMRAYYEVVSGGPGVPRDVQRDLSLHHPDAAIFIHQRNEKKERVLVRVSVTQYHANAKAGLDAGFFERDIRREVKHFGHSVQLAGTDHGLLGGSPC